MFVPQAFFIPHLKDTSQQETVYQNIRTFVSEQVGPLKDRRIQQISFSHDGQDFDLSVGQIHPEIGEDVVAIFEGHIYYICTPTRGVVRGEPYLVGRSETHGTQDFAGQAKTAGAAN